MLRKWLSFLYKFLRSRPDEADDSTNYKNKDGENMMSIKTFALGTYLIFILFMAMYFLGSLMTVETDKTKFAEKTCNGGPCVTPTPTESLAANSNREGPPAAGADEAGNLIRQANTSVSPSPASGASKQEFVQVVVPKEVYLNVPLWIFTFSQIISADSYVFLVVLFSGMLGGITRSIYSFVWHMGLNNFWGNWVWYYISVPFTGAALALIIYFVIRGGFYGSSFGSGLALNPFSFAALGALTGLFTENAMDKLKQTADTLLSPSTPKVKNAKDALDKKIRRQQISQRREDED